MNTKCQSINFQKSIFFFLPLWSFGGKFLKRKKISEGGENDNEIIMKFAEGQIVHAYVGKSQGYNRDRPPQKNLD